MRSSGKRSLAAVAAVLLAVVAGSAPVRAGVVAPPEPSGVPSALAGDFSGDGTPDIALAGASGWNGVAVAKRTGSGFGVTHTPAPAFAAWASLPG